MDVFDPKAPLKLGAEGVLVDERKEEAETALGALDISNEISPAREARTLILLVLLCLVNSPSFDNFPFAVHSTRQGTFCILPWKSKRMSVDLVTRLERQPNRSLTAQQHPTVY